MQAQLFNLKAKSIAIIVLLLTFFLAPPQTNAQTLNGDEIIGKWYNAEQNQVILVYKKGNEYVGKMLWCHDQKHIDDANNPDPALQSRNIVGANILQAFIFQDGSWVEGNWYRHENGETYPCKMWIENNKLKVHQYYYAAWLGLGSTTVFEPLPENHVANR